MVLTESENKLKKEDSAPDFSLKGADEKNYSLSDFKGKPTLIIFMCNHCPYVIAKLDELNRIAEHFKDKINVVGINSNDPEYEPEDSFENMKAFVQQGKIKFTYLHDPTQEIAKAYGAVCTPDPFLFDKDHKLIFHSRIDDPAGMSPAKRHEFFEAIEELLSSGKISIEENPSIGCSIKWK